MEQRLKKQRNRLFLRVTLILLAVWLVVSSAYCIILTYSEKNSVQNRMLSNLSYVKNRISEVAGRYDFINYVYLNISYLIYSDSNEERDWNSQVIVIDADSNEIIIDTSSKIIVNYGIKSGVENSEYLYGFIDYNTMVNAMSDEQYKKTRELLNTERDDGKRYELICTKFQICDFEFIPVELKIALTEGNDTWFISDEIVDTFTLSDNIIQGEDIQICNDMRRNIVPVNFFLNDDHSKDYMGALTEEQREMSAVTISAGWPEYIFYTTDHIYLNYMNEAYDYSTADRDANYGNGGATYVIQYAQKINLFDKCKERLFIGAAVIFGFFLTIAFILCLMIWKMFKSQALEEQKRSDMTNALAHDIKTPLFVISGYAYSLKEDIDRDERDNYLEKIIEQTDEINTLVHKMLNLGKLNSYKMTLNRSDFDLYDLIKEIRENFTILPDGKTIKLTHSGDNLVNADRELIRTALQNLMDNAVKYSLADSEIQINVSDHTFSISNQSEPLTKSDLKQIWQPYVRKDKSRHQNGNGLGLSIVKSIFELHAIRCDMTMKNSMLTCRVEF